MFGSTEPGELLQIPNIPGALKFTEKMERFAEAGQDYRRFKGLPLQAPGDRAAPVKSPPDFHLATSVSVEFGETNRELGLYFIESGESKHTQTNLNGQAVWHFKRGWNYVYFFIDPTFKWTLTSNVSVLVEYDSSGSAEWSSTFVV